MSSLPSLSPAAIGGIVVHTDPILRDSARVVVAFSERGGGASTHPYTSLDLAAHVGDEPSAVDENRSRLLGSLGIGRLRERLTMSEQVHGDEIAEVRATDAGAGAFASGGSAPLPASDALLTSVPDVPLLMCYADCVPVVLVVPGPPPVVAVAHAGWRGCLARLPGNAAGAVAARAGRSTADVLAYIGPHICGEHYEVDEERLWRFRSEFATIRSARDRLDLGAVVSESLRDAGVRRDRVARVGSCTAEQRDRLFSYRMEGTTGRHGALAVILSKGAHVS